MRRIDCRGAVSTMSALAPVSQNRGLFPARFGQCRARRAGPVDFGRDVRPILSDKCYRCHGPDEKARKAKLRFDTKEGAFRQHDGETVIIPGKSAESEMILRVSSMDTDEMMPPPESKLERLPPKELAP